MKLYNYYIIISIICIVLFFLFFFFLCIKTKYFTLFLKFFKNIKKFNNNKNYIFFLFMKINNK